MPVPTAPKPGILFTTHSAAATGSAAKRPSGPVAQDESMTMSAPKDMQHVDRSKLYTDVTYRVKFVAALVGFTKDDQALVAELAPKIEPLLPAFIDAVYTHMFQFDVLAQSFLNRMQGFDGQVVYKLENLSINSEQITFRRSMLLKYFVRSMRSMSDFESLIPYLDWVAAIHSKQSFVPIEFIHSNGILGFMSGELIKLVAQLHLPQDKMLKSQAALTRMLWVQNDLFAMHNVADGQEFHEAHLASPMKTEPERNNAMPPVHPEQKAKRRQSFGVPTAATSEAAMSCMFAGGMQVPAPPASVTPPIAGPVSNAPAAVGLGGQGEACEMTALGSGTGINESRGNGAPPSTKSGRESLTTTLASDKTETATGNPVTPTDVNEQVKCPVDTITPVQVSGKKITTGQGEEDVKRKSYPQLLATGDAAATEQGA